MGHPNLKVLMEKRSNRTSSSEILSRKQIESVKTLLRQVFCSRVGSYADKHANNVASGGPIKTKMSFFCPLPGG